MLISSFCLLVVAASLSDIGAEGQSVTIDSSDPKQTITSFGASGAWWPNDLKNFPSQIQDQLAEFLFSEDGIHLSSYRYNVGSDGGSDSQNVTAPNKRVESFLLTNGTYDWSRDAAGVSFLQKAEAAGVPYITFFINAAPSHIADNSAACGWDLTAAKTLDFADYISTVLSYWIDHGVDIKYISPMNEPINNRNDCDQEGMGVFPWLREQAFSAIKAALSNSSSAGGVSIIGDETSQPTTESVEYPFWLSSSTQYLSNIAVHNYDFPDDTALTLWYTGIQALVGGNLPPIKFTETCCATSDASGPLIFGAQYDPTMNGALRFARYVWQFMTIAQAESFDWWTAVSNLPCSPSVYVSCATTVNNTAGYNDGLVYVDPNYSSTHDFTLYYSKRAFMMKHFAYFHRPGATRYDVPQTQLPDGVNAFATKAQEADGTWSVLFMNSATSAYNLTLQAPSSTATLQRAVRTTNGDDFTDVNPLPTVQDGATMLSLPAQSFLTLQFSA
ncbi:MAG: hypothetical protein M1820_003430 [Bogoriella megaspora]|nr:MAG: hypothetical protein M1820_003430 [Bogoriella megaspora]